MVATRGRGRCVGLVALLLASACTVPSGRRRGDLLRVEPLGSSPRCTPSAAIGTLSPAGPARATVAIELEQSCALPEEAVYAVEQRSRVPYPTVLVASVGAGVGAVLAVFAASLLIKDPPGTGLHSGRGAGELLLLLGLGVGGGTFASVAAARQTTVVGEERELRAGPATWKRTAATGALELGDQSFELTDGRASLPVDAPAFGRLDEARLETLRLTWTEPGPGAWTACHRALAGWTPEQSPNCERFDDARRCRQRGWATAVEVEDALRSVCSTTSPATNATPGSADDADTPRKLRGP